MLASWSWLGGTLDGEAALGVNTCRVGLVDGCCGGSACGTSGGGLAVVCTGRGAALFDGGLMVACTGGETAPLDGVVVSPDVPPGAELGFPNTPVVVTATAPPVITTTAATAPSTHQRRSRRRLAAAAAWSESSAEVSRVARSLLPSTVIAAGGCSSWGPIGPFTSS